jgi:hypothetical protein
VAVATPYTKNKTVVSQLYWGHLVKSTILQLDTDEAEIHLIPSDSLQISCNVQGFGFPRSKLEPRFVNVFKPDSLSGFFTQKKRGYFTELDNNINILYPFPNNGVLNLNLLKGNATIILPDSLQSFIFNANIGKGTLELDLPSAFKPRIKLRGEFTLDDRTGFNDEDGIYINEDFRLDLVVKQGTIILR